MRVSPRSIAPSTRRRAFSPSSCLNISIGFTRCPEAVITFPRIIQTIDGSYYYYIFIITLPPSVSNLETWLRCFPLLLKYWTVEKCTKFLMRLIIIISFIYIYINIYYYTICHDYFYFVSIQLEHESENVESSCRIFSLSQVRKILLSHIGHGCKVSCAFFKLD